MKNHIFCVLFILFTALFFSCQSPPPRPNVVILFTDDQRANTIHAWGNEEIHTPNMDRLAAMGVSFTRAYVMGSHHGAVCAPSRAMLLSGRPFTHIPKSFIDQGQGQPDTAFDFTLFPEWLRAQGYTTFFTGKWHNNTSRMSAAFTGGKNIFIGGMHWPKDGGHRRPQLWDFDTTNVYAPENRWQAEAFSSTMYSDAAIEFLRQQDGEKPFCLYVAYTSPHDPREAPEEFLQLYDTADITLPPNFLPEHPFDNGHLRTRDENLAPFPRTPEIVKTDIAAYYAMISEVDAQIGRVLDELEAQGLMDNTIIVFAGDNGLAIGQHGLYGKQSLYEHSARVPLIIAAPGIAAGRRAETLCYLYDIFPTLGGLMGREVPASVEGRSLLPALDQEETRIREHVFLAHAREMRAVRTDDDWKLIQYFVKGEPRQQLYNLKGDPWETRNLADEPAFREKREALTQLLIQDIGSYDDAFLRAHINLRQERFDGPVEAIITQPFPTTEIRFTLDGSEPGPQSALFTAPFILSESAAIKTAIFHDGQQISTTATAEARISPYIKGLSLLTPPSEKYPANGALTLLDGANGTSNALGSHWLGYEGRDFAAIVELKKEGPISEVGIRYLSHAGNWIFPPARIAVYLSNDGKNFEKAIEQDLPPLPGPEEPKAITWIKTVDGKKARFIKFEVKNIGNCPDWHLGKGEKAWLFVDEVLISTGPF
ncbi:MAG: sulfatase-like hydrolase/transferase [Phaeodactylibacter sp.]|nr:sulfatase-like hydrolase/transferase [Phaeodactylibacter sp.]MCB9051608.1 sulfatase-like hydrolase/transferase [Lewinellaceae bacterium]